jgi:MFS family permease
MATRIHRAWLVAGVTFLVLLASAAFRSSVGVLIVPFEEEFGWSRSATSLAVSVNLVLYGLTAPFAAALMERFGIRRIAALALLLISAGTGLTLVMTDAWQLVLLWGVLVGLGTGATALVFGALVTSRWFVKRRGLVLGVLGAAWATGQLVFLPVIASTIEHNGWRAASGAIAVACAALIPLVWFVIADRPADVGLRPYGATGDLTVAETAHNATHSGWTAARTALTTLVDAARTRAFWLLAGTFFICGWTTNGIISTHFVPAMHDHGMAATAAASLLAVVGLFDIIGTVGSGWLSDRIDPRILLVVYYSLRGTALIALPVFLGPDIDPPLLVIMVFFGLDWVATVPPTALLCGRIFGPERGPIVFGWVFASHMVGAAVAAAATGIIREAVGDYATAWFLAGGLALLAALACLAIPKSPVGAAGRQPEHSPV